MDVCVICKISDGGDLIQLRQLGIDTINKVERKVNIYVKIGDYVHKKCRKDYIHKWYIESAASGNNNPLLRHTRSSSTSFDFQKNCFLCAFPVTARKKQNKATSCVESRYCEIDKKILAEVSNRGYDDWASAVYGRIESVIVIGQVYLLILSLSI